MLLLTEDSFDLTGLFAIEVLEETRLGSEKLSAGESGVSLLVHGGREGSQRKWKRDMQDEKAHMKQLIDNKK